MVFFNRSVNLLALALCFTAQMTSLVSAEKIEFYNKVVSSGTNCFLESIADTVNGKLNNFQVIMSIVSPRSFLLTIVAVVLVRSESRSLVLTITDPKGKKLETLRDTEEMRHHFAAFYTGNYQICI